jgi:prepilin-type processing-associated H-X9-DG protein
VPNGGGVIDSFFLEPAGFTASGNVAPGESGTYVYPHLWSDILPTPLSGNLVVGISNYIGSAGYYPLGIGGPGAGETSFDPKSQPPYNLPANVSWPGIYKAVDFNKGGWATIGSISDGTSNTVAFGETRVWNGSAPRRWILAWGGAGSLPSTSGLTPGTSRFSSNHTGVINFSFADGSVHAIGTSIDALVFWELSGASDGTVIDASQLTF